MEECVNIWWGSSVLPKEEIIRCKFDCGFPYDRPEKNHVKKKSPSSLYPIRKLTCFLSLFLLIRILFFVLLRMRINNWLFWYKLIKNPLRILWNLSKIPQESLKNPSRTPQKSLKNVEIPLLPTILQESFKNLLKSLWNPSKIFQKCWNSSSADNLSRILEESFKSPLKSLWNSSKIPQEWFFSCYDRCSYRLPDERL